MERSKTSFHKDEVYESFLTKTVEELKTIQRTREGTAMIAMAKGMIEVTPETAEEIREELREIWGDTYPDIFEDDSNE